MLQHGIAADAVIGLAGGEGVAGRGGGKRFKADVREQARGTGVPWVGDDEGFVALVKGAKGVGFFGLSEHATSLSQGVSTSPPP
ncbi:hypothetical protein SBA5_190016 [Candidatus Sulfotelmatomonas gaucii]|uniref:Uncharacterized protein n=1 Tax=Candidatus Sulfuritelmatomonas gaucii TaxID=2043161 RepID=A0A2N9L6Y9_9BACT|nr:hypothetical protein SBA5_190016 [Candidatus Sulfotelmatomonas gaucii]